MEQRGMHPQQITHQTVHAYGPPSFDNLQSSLYPGFPELLGGGSKTTQLPRPLPPYVQQHYILDRDPPMETQKSPPPSHRSSDRAHGHPSLRHPASPPQDMRPTTPPPKYFLPRYLVLLSNLRILPLDPWAFTDNANTHLTEMQGGLPHIYESMYPSHQQPLSPLATTHPSTYSQAVPQKGPSTTTQNADPSPTSFQGKNEGNTTAENSPQLRSWGGAGSLDPATGVFSRAADHPRIRTAQACEKCRARKAKCSGEHPSCQRCLTRGLVCAYAPERRMRGPNKPKPPHSPLPDGSQPASAAGQKTRKRASTMPSAPHRSPQIWGRQQHHKQQQEHGVAAPTSPASSIGSGSLGYPPLSESEASPMTPPHSSLDGRQLSVPVVGFSATQRVLVQDFPTTAQRRAQTRVSEGSSHDDADAATTRGALAVRTSSEAHIPVFFVPS
ncbi:hypothetical protein BJY52DRAFT_1358207 [Lactarius psammicola]|nr:hypothetical protein BJY52DRAFT_1358207 [Lactarius psammicola]